MTNENNDGSNDSPDTIKIINYGSNDLYKNCNLILQIIKYLKGIGWLIFNRKTLNFIYWPSVGWRCHDHLDFI